MDKLIREEIERFKLLSNYDNKKTLDENYKSSEVISEQRWGLGNLLKLGGREAGTLSKTAIKEVEELFRLIPTEMKKFGADAAEVTAKLQSKSFTAKELGEFRKTVFKNITDVKTRKELADDMVKSKAFQDLFTSSKEKKVVDELIKKGYSGDDAKVLIDRYKKTGGRFLDDIKGTVKPTKTKAPINPQSLGNQTARKSYAEIAWEMLQAPFKVGGFIISNFWKIFWAGVGIGVVYYLWNYLNQIYKVYPKCLYRSPSMENLKRMNEQNLEYLFISETGNEFIDDNGGGRFYVDNKFETDNQKYKGKWSDESDMDVLITLDNGQKHSLPCEDISDFEDEREKDVAPTKTKTQAQIEKERILSSWDGKYEKCDDFPMTIGCINDGVIGTVQICLGLPKDGKFSAKVLDALEKEGYGFELSFDIYKTIQSKCGMSSSESGFASNL